MRQGVMLTVEEAEMLADWVRHPKFTYRRYGGKNVGRPSKKILKIVEKLENAVLERTLDESIQV